MKHTKDNSPLQAIRQNCYDCSDGAREINLESAILLTAHSTLFDLE